MDSFGLEWIQERVKKNEYLFSLHADSERRNDGLSIEDIESALLNGVVLEDYPTHSRGPCCLVYGVSSSQDVHLVCGRNRSGWMVVITVYIPKLPKWVTPTQRRPKA